MDWNTLIVALVSASPGAVMGWVALRRQAQEADSSNVADALRLKDEYKKEVDDLKADVEALKASLAEANDRIGALEIANGECQKALEGCQEGRKELTMGVGILRRQLAKLGENPNYTPGNGM